MEDLNKKAIAYLESNQYEKSLDMFQKAVSLSRNVQSLNNLAYFYATEEDEFEQAILLLKEVIDMKPDSYFPYALLGQIFVQTEQYSESIPYLKKAISINSTVESNYNLGASYYQTGNVHQAVRYFFSASQMDSKFAFSYLRSLFESGDKEKATELLDEYTSASPKLLDMTFGELPIAELYLEMGLFEKANIWFQKAFTHYYLEPQWIFNYAYSLCKVQEYEKAKTVIQSSLQKKQEEILHDENDDEFDEDWTEKDKHEYLEERYKEKTQYEMIMEKILNGDIPDIQFDPSFLVSCYLFGCTQHRNPNYIEE